MAAHSTDRSEFDAIATAVLRTERIAEGELERLARRARRGDAAAGRVVTLQMLCRVVARVQEYEAVGADRMELFEVGAAALADAPMEWHPRREAFVDRVDRSIQDRMQPLLNEATGRSLVRLATALHGQAPRPRPANSPLPDLLSAR